MTILIISLAVAFLIGAAIATFITTWIEEGILWMSLWVFIPSLLVFVLGGMWFVIVFLAGWLP